MNGTCELCDAPAVYAADGGELVCADCACWTSAQRNGERYATVQVLGFAVDMMRRARFSDEQIRAAFEETLQTGAAPERQVASEARDDRWLRDVVPLSVFGPVNGAVA
jgi:hypothetical protein